ncbi:hypothetical protein M9Y10_001653 [Tritrichomonas musculus]|uniref:Protein kinase domain-containing protein n=1 Tax=Tritrichomonas musculus TaxID=1915356 RepID=A0ABR2L7J6_9EUKA
MGCCHSHTKVINADEPVKTKKEHKSNNEAENKKVIEIDAAKQGNEVNNPNLTNTRNHNDNPEEIKTGGNISHKNSRRNNIFVIDDSEEEEIPSLTLDTEYEKDLSNGSTISEVSESSYSSYDEENDDHGLVISKAYGYKYVKKLGKGAFSTVIEMKKDNVSYAIKVCDMSKDKNKFFKYSSQQDVKNNNNKKRNRSSEFDPKEEIAIMKRFSHPYVIKFFDFYEDVKSKKIYIVMEYLSGGDISKCTTLQQKKMAFAQSVSGLQYIHFQRIAHLDIKVDNILRAEDGSIRITDFGISELVPEGTNKISIQMKGTPAFSAPEMFGEAMYDPFAADVWSLGVTLYFILFNRLPFIADKLSEIQRKVTAEEVKFPAGSDSKASDLIRKMLRKNPDKRIKLNEIWDHPWMEGMRDKVSQNSFTKQKPGSQIYKSITPSMRKSSISKI